MKRTVVLIVCLAVALTATVVMTSKIGKNVYYYEDRHSQQSSAAEMTLVGGISDYDKLVSALMNMIRFASVSERLTVFDYDGDLMDDLKRATDYLTQTYPIGNYAVSSIVYSPHYIASYCELQVSINYNHTYEEINTITRILSSEELEERMTDAIRSFTGKRVFDISGIDVNTDNVTGLFEKCWLQSDVYAYGLIKAEFVFYPKDASECLLEMVLSYADSKEEMIKAVSLTQDTVNGLTETFSGSDIKEKIAFTEEYLENNLEPDADSAYFFTEDFVVGKVLQPDTAVGAFSEGRASRVGTAMAASALLKGLGAENEVVSGILADGTRALWIYIDDGGEGGSGLFYDPNAVFGEEDDVKSVFAYGEAESIFSFNKELFGF